MSKGASGHFSGTKGHNKVFSNYPKTVHSGRQDKHIVGTNNYQEGKSVFSGTKADADTLIKQYSGTGNILGNNKERVDFGKPIGYYVDPITHEKMLTTKGIIHYSKDGAHIVPSHP